jgi:acyl carrier protein
MNIHDKVLTIISENIEKKSPVHLNTDLQKELNVDSFALVMIMNALEDAFSISIQESDFADIHTAEDIVRALLKKNPQLAVEK